MRVLVVRLGALGDIVHTVPAVAALAAARAARIDWLVDRRHAAVLEVFDLPVARVTVDPSGSWRETLAVVGRLRTERYDVAIDFQGLLKSALLARASGARRVVGFARAALREPLAAACYTESVPVALDLHIVQKNLALLAALDVRDREVRLPLSPAVRPPVSPGGSAPVVLNPGAGWPNKRWPPERFGELAAVIARERGIRSLVTWGPGERVLAEEVVEASRGAASLAPATSIADLVRLLAGARLVVSGDTGPIHLAAAAGRPIVGIYGPTNPARNGPWLPADRCLSRFALCECHHKRRCTAARWCLGRIEVGEVASAVTDRLGSAAG